MTRVGRCPSFNEVCWPSVERRAAAWTRGHRARAFVPAFKPHYGDEVPVSFVLQPSGVDAMTVATVVEVDDLREFRDPVADVWCDRVLTPS